MLWCTLLLLHIVSSTEYIMTAVAIPDKEAGACGAYHSHSAVRQSSPSKPVVSSKMERNVM